MQDRGSQWTVEFDANFTGQIRCRSIGQCGVGQPAYDPVQNLTGSFTRKRCRQNRMALNARKQQLQVTIGQRKGLASTSRGTNDLVGQGD